LRQNSDLTPPANRPASGGETTSNGTNYLNITSPTGNLFFRLAACRTYVGWEFKSELAPRIPQGKRGSQKHDLGIQTRTEISNLYKNAESEFSSSLEFRVGGESLGGLAGEKCINTIAERPKKLLFGE
jgi:hypothetical protein